MLETVGIFAVASVGGTAGRFHISDFPGFRTQGPERRGGVHRTRAFFHIVGLLNDASLFPPEFVEGQNEILKVHFFTPSLYLKIEKINKKTDFPLKGTAKPRFHPF